MKDRDFEVAAGIDVGSNYLRMVIAEISQANEIEVLEDVIQRTNIGHDTFGSGRISLDTTHDTCRTLVNYSQLMKDYGVTRYKAVATSGIREAENREYILDQIRLKSNLEVTVINNAQERFLMFKALRYQQTDKDLLNDNTLVVDITSGGVEVSIFGQGHLNFTEYIKVGSLRLREILADLESKTIDFPRIMEEYIESKIYLLKPQIQKAGIKTFIGLGGELNTIHRITYNDENPKPGNLYIEKEALTDFKRKICKMSTEQMLNTYRITPRKGDILLPSVIIFNQFLTMTEAAGIYAPLTSLRYGLLYELLEERYKPSTLKPSKEPFKSKAAINDIISAAWYIAEKYGADTAHVTYITQTALSLFDQTWKLHHLGEKERLYLEVAGILHTTGNFVNYNEHDIYSYDIIRSQSIMGFSNRERDLIANIVRYHADEIPDHYEQNYMAFNDNDKIIISKLTAILKIAEALDAAHIQKVETVDLQLEDDVLKMSLSSKHDTLLEEWNIKKVSPFFEEVMGVNVAVKRKR